jgi:hypothetical protein
VELMSIRALSWVCQEIFAVVCQLGLDKYSVLALDYCVGSHLIYG